MSGPVALDIQANGWIDDGGESGAIRVARVDADLVMVPFRNDNAYFEAFGSGGSATLTTSAYTSNPDGSGSGYTITIPSGTGNGARIWMPFSGRCFGVRWRSVSSTPDFTVVVDGEAVKVEGWPAWLTTEGVTTQLVNARAMALTHDHLDPAKPHIAQITFVSEAAASRSWVLFGTLLDRRFGLADPRRYAHVLPTGQLTASAVAIPLANVATDRNVQAIRKVLYVNTSGSARTVTIKNGAAVIKTLYLAATGSAGDSAEFDPGADLVISSSITHQADAATSVNYQVIGAY